MENVNVTRLRELRESRGISQVALAATIGLTRQSVHSIESGRSVPSVDIALRMARALGCTVESLFGESAAESPLVAEPVLGLSTSRVALANISGRWLAYALDRGGIGRSADGLASNLAQGKLSVELLRPAVEARENVVIMGCAPALGIVCERLNSCAGPGRYLWFAQSSTNALSALNQRKAHIAGVHLVDTKTGEANIPDVRKHVSDLPVVIVTLARWEVGLVSGSNPKTRISNVSQLTRTGVRLVTREPGSGARRVLEREIKQAGIGSDVARGALVTATGHLEVAEAVALGAGDVGVATRDAAMAFGLDFVPLAEERYDLVVPRDELNDPRIARLFDAMTAAPLRRELSAMGYDVSPCGNRIAELFDA